MLRLGPRRASPSIAQRARFVAQLQVEHRWRPRRIPNAAHGGDDLLYQRFVKIWLDVSRRSGARSANPNAQWRIGEPRDPGFAPHAPRDEDCRRLSTTAILNPD